MIQRVACPILVSRDEEMGVLEDALLAANRGEGRLVAVAGEAGMGKTRLVTELTRRARKLGAEVMWGGCSEAELSLPYLPFVEAIGNHLASTDLAALTEQLGLSRASLAQLFPQLGAPGPGEADPGNAKSRLFEAFVQLLAVPARERGLLLVIDDAHWADASTRELLDHLARRLSSMRALAVVTYRSDEIDRRHPLVPMLQAWRRSRLVDTVTVDPLSWSGVVSMIRAIFEEERVSEDIAELMHDRSEGNPFVLEEMLREAVDRGDIFYADSSWDRKPVDTFQIPATVRDTILLRLSRLDPAHLPALDAASVLGRRFDPDVLSTVSNEPETTVHAALAEARAHQLIEEDPQHRGEFRWRHALTQEAIYGEIVLPRRQQLHARAAEALAATGSHADVANHLLEAGRFDEAVEQCLLAAQEANASAAFVDEAALYERALIHITDEPLRAEVTCKLGVAYRGCDTPARSGDALSEGIALLERLGDDVRAAHYRTDLGRTRWLQKRPLDARDEFHRAHKVLEPLGPSADLASLYFREASQSLFENDFEGCLTGMQRAYEIAETVGFDRIRIHAITFIGLALVDLGEVAKGLATMEEGFEAAIAGGHQFVAANSQWNLIWLNAHLMLGDSDIAMRRLEGLAAATGVIWVRLARSYILRTTGVLPAALEEVETALAESERLGNPKLVWRSKVQAGEVLTEMGRVDEALERLPWPPEEAEAQDHVYEAPAQIHTRLAAGRIDEAVAVARLVHADRELVANYSETLAAAVEAFIAGGMPAEARDLVETGKRRAFPVGGAWLREAEARILLASDDASSAFALLEPAAEEAERLGFLLAATRMRVLAGRAAARAANTDEAVAMLRRAATDADRMCATLLGDEARAEAHPLGVEIPLGVAAVRREREDAIPVGERMITSMFADMRGYTAMTAVTTPEVMAELLTSFYRMATIEVERNRGMIDKFAGDAAMATFNVSGASIDHPLQAVKAALGIRDRAALMDLPIGIGIAVGPAVVGRVLEGANAFTMGSSVNLAARLQTAATAGEVVLSDEVHRRVSAWLEERGLAVTREELVLKGFDDPQVVYRIGAPHEPRGK